MIDVKKNEATAAYRRMYFHCVDVTDGMTPETGEAGGQPQVSVNGDAFGTQAIIGVLVAIGNGRYCAELTQAGVNIADRSVIEGRYKSANTAEAVGTTIQIIEYPVDASVATVSGYVDKIDDATNGLTAIKAEVEGLAGAAMRGTDNAALASVCTETRLAELDAANIPANVDTLLSRISATVATALTKLADVAIAGTETAGSLLRLFYDRVTGAVALDSTVAKEATINTKIPTALTFTGSDVKATLDGEEVTPTTASKAGYALSAAGIQAIWDALTSAFTTVGSIGKKLADWVVGTIDTYTGNTKQTGDSFARLGAPAGASVSADIAAIPTTSYTSTLTALSNAIAALQTDLGDPSVDATTIYAQALLIKSYVDDLETRLSATRAGYIDNLSGGAVALNSTVAKEATLANATYGLSALKTLIDAIDTSTELQAKFTEIKGAGWTNETLKAIKDAISGGGVDPQTIRDAMKLAPSIGVPADGSIDAKADSILARIGTFTGIGWNTVLGFFRALMRKDAGITLPTDIGGNFDNTTDSVEAISDKATPEEIWAYATRKLTSRNISEGDDIAREQTLNGSIVKGIIQRRILIKDTEVLEVVRGDVWPIPINLGSEESWVNKKVYYIAKKDPKTDNSTAIVNREITVTDAANRIGTITLTKDETAIVGRYYSEIEARDLNDDNPRTDYQGILKIIQDARQ